MEKMRKTIFFIHFLSEHSNFRKKAENQPPMKFGFYILPTRGNYGGLPLVNSMPFALQMAAPKRINHLPVINSLTGVFHGLKGILYDEVVGLNIGDVKG
jgi:hypothetical protein